MQYGTTLHICCQVSHVAVATVYAVFMSVRGSCEEARQKAQESVCLCWQEDLGDFMRGSKAQMNFLLSSSRRRDETAQQGKLLFEP